MSEAARTSDVPDPAWRSADEILTAELPLALRGYRMQDVDALLGELALQVSAMEQALERVRAGGGAAAATPVGVRVEAHDAEPTEVHDEAHDEARDEHAGPRTAPVDAERPRETYGVTAGARRRALLPSAALTGVAAVALLFGWGRADRTATLIAIAVSALALLGVAVAVWRTRDRTTDRAIEAGSVDGPSPDASVPDASVPDPGASGSAG